jgi:hypothetical protein
MREAVYLLNRLPIPATSGGSSGVPHTILQGIPTAFAHVKVFGCTAYLGLEERYMDQLSPNALRYMFIG